MENFKFHVRRLKILLIFLGIIIIGLQSEKKVFHFVQFIFYM